MNGKTMVGCNEDAWRLTSRIWFENGTNEGPYGAAFTGSRYDGYNGFAPQSGMNEYGLAFSRLAALTPEKEFLADANKRSITIDKSGSYLIVEPYTMTIGNDPKYVLSNFCPSLLLTMNNLAYLILIGFFAYWGLFNVFN